MLCCLLVSNIALAAKHTHRHINKKEHWFSHTERGHFEVIGALGAAQLNAGNSRLGVTSSETDTLVQTNSNQWDTLAAQLGAGYVYNIHFKGQYTGQVKWLSSIEPELNVYHLASNSIKGDVWRFNSAAFNELTYDIPLHSTRLMLDGALTIATWQRLSVYAIGGIGNAWNRVGYSDTDNDSDSISPCPEQRLKLNSNTSAHFAWEVGAGLIYAANNRIGVSVEYLYTDLGRVSTSANGNAGTTTAPMIVPARFRLKSNQGFIGLHVAL